MDTFTSQQSVKYDAQGAYLVFAVDRKFFAMPYQKIISVLDNPPATRMPGLSDHARGVMDFMGEPITYLDFRKLIGARGMREEMSELHETLQARKQDHLNWIAKLKEAVTNGTEITVQTDPHLCAFGKWYDSFQTENLSLKRFLKGFDQPHRQIHGIAVRAKELIASGNVTAALHLIGETENRQLAELVRLFDSAKEELRKATSEYAIVARSEERGMIALAVDEPRYFGQLETITHPLPKMATLQENGFVDACGSLRGEGVESEILIIDLERLVEKQPGRLAS